MTQITYDYFTKAAIRTGQIVRVEDFPGARKPAYKLWIDFGELGIKTSSARITERYAKEALLDSMVIAVTNFPPRQVADFLSEVLVLGAMLGEDKVVLVRPDGDVSPGKRVL